MATKKVLEKKAKLAVRKAEQAVKRAATAVRKSAKKARKTADKNTVTKQRSKVSAAAKDIRGLISANAETVNSGPVTGPHEAALPVSGSVVADRRHALPADSAREGVVSPAVPAPVTPKE